MSSYKTCTICKKQLGKEQFYKHPSTRDKLKKECKKCYVEKQSLYQQVNKEQRSAYNRKRYVDRLRAVEQEIASSKKHEGILPGGKQ